MTATIRVRVQRRPTLKLKMLPRFPAGLAATSPITLDETGGTRTFGLSIDDLQDSLDPIYAPIDAENFTQTGTGAATITLQSIFQDKIFTPEMFSSTTISAAYNTAVASVPDATAAIQAAITALAAAGGGTLLLGPRAYGVTTVTIPSNNIYIRGSGMNATQIVHKMTTSSSAFYFSAGASILSNCGISDLSIQSADTTYNKIAINASDVSEFVAENINVAFYPVDGSMYRGGGGAIGKGFLLQGRELGKIRSVQVYAQMPCNVAVNPNQANGGIDSWTFQDCLFCSDLSGATYHNITVDTGVVILNTSFRSQNWIGGVDGFHWVGSAAAASYGLTFAGIKSEQSGDGGTGYTFNIQNSNSGAIKIADSIAGDRNGIKLRNVPTVTIDNFFYATAAAGVGLNIDSTVLFTEVRNCFWQSGTTATITGQNIARYSNFISGRSTAISSDVIYTTSTPTEFFNSIGLGTGLIAAPPSGTPTVTMPTSTGTMAVTASAPLVLNATTGNLTITGAALTKTDDTNVTLTLGGSPASALVNAASLTLGWTGQLGLTRGGTAASLTASNGGIVYSTATAMAILSGTATARQMLQSGASGAPAWSTTTWPATTTVNRILYSSSASVIGEITSANSSILVTDGSGVPSLSTTLPAHTLGGAISGGGNQINNVVIGASSPNPGTFTILAATSALTLTNNQDGSTEPVVSNNSGGTSAGATYQATNGTNLVRYGMKGTASSAYGALAAGVAFMYGVTDFVFMSDGGKIVWAAGGNSEKMRLGTDGGLCLGVTTAAGAGSLAGAGALQTAAPTVKTNNYTHLVTDSSLIFNGGASITLTLLNPATYPGRELLVKTIAAFTVVSASSNVVPQAGGAAGTAILAATAGKFALLKSDGTNWVIMTSN